MISLILVVVLVASVSLTTADAASGSFVYNSKTVYCSHTRQSDKVTVTASTNFAPNQTQVGVIISTYEYIPKSGGEAVVKYDVKRSDSYAAAYTTHTTELARYCSYVQTKHYAGNETLHFIYLQERF